MLGLGLLSYLSDIVINKRMVIIWTSSLSVMPHFIPHWCLLTHQPFKKSVFKARFGKVAVQEITVDCFLNLYNDVSNIIVISLNWFAFYLVQESHQFFTTDNSQSHQVFFEYVFHDGLLLYC